MKKITACLIFFCLAAAPFATRSEDSAMAGKGRCPVCGMYVAMFADWNARVAFRDGETAIFDGAKDMFKYYLNVRKYNSLKSRENIKEISVKDYYTKASINALTAFYVIWSDLYGPMGHEPIPFEKKADAEKFLKEHKGRKILNFQDINDKVITALDNP
jgi:copper chaperone NosL